METGILKFYKKEKGFGFITPENGGSDIFVHSSGLVDIVKDGDAVTYEVEQGKKGLNAVNVKVK